MSAILKARMLVAAAALAGLGACSIFPPPVVRTAYMLPPVSVPAQTQAAPRADWRLRIESPSAVSALDSRHWWVLSPDSSVGAYRDVLWAENATVLVRERLVSVMLDAGRFQGVNSGLSELPADFALDSNLRAFRIEREGTDTGAVYIRLDADLLHLNSRRIVGNRTFEQRVPLADLQPETIVRAFGRALDTVAVQLMDWVIEAGNQADVSVPDSHRPKFLQRQPSPAPEA